MANIDVKREVRTLTEVSRVELAAMFLNDQISDDDYLRVLEELDCDDA